ncbi:phosphatase PAP2 family protein [Candidatus Pacebacteria bacterium]|nr:phosphatase PAP2 family protein [Candidatus Paceibacterota bacterium]
METILIFLFTKVFSSTIFFVLIAGIAMHFLVRKNFWTGLSIAGVALLGAWSVYLLKNFFAVPRPAGALVELSSFAFPSAHAAGAVLFSTIVYVYLTNVFSVRSRTLIMVLIGFILLVGFSRVFLQVHTPIQVAAGYTVGALWSALLLYLSRHQSNTNASRQRR